MLYRIELESWESVGAKELCITFTARYYFYARADSMQKRGYRGAHGRLRVIKLERIRQWKGCSTCLSLFGVLEVKSDTKRACRKYRK